MKLFSLTANVFLLGFLVINLLSCKKNNEDLDTAGSWDKQSANFIGASRSGAVCFTINDTVYVGTGFSYDSGRLADLWKYDPLKNSWSKKASLPGIGRSNAVAFSLNGKGYVGTGLADNQSFLSDFYEFDPTAGPQGQWTRIADFPSARIGGLAFVVKGRAFVGTGRDSVLGDLKDLWEYNPADNSWVAQSSMGGKKRENAFVMVINDIAYIGGGTDIATYNTDFYKFDITQNSGQGAWTALNGLTGKDVNGNAVLQPAPRAFTSTFTIGNYGYLTCGISGSNLYGDLWQYDPTHDTWIQLFDITKNSPSGERRNDAVGFSLTTGSGTFGYLVTGESSPSIQFNDFWKFNPTGVEPDNK